VPRIAAQGPRDHDDTASEHTGADVPALTVILTIIDRRGMQACKNLRRVGEVETAVTQRAVALGRTENRDAQDQLLGAEAWSQRVITPGLFSEIDPIPTHSI
jgi:hypothetical protein